MSHEWDSGFMVREPSWHKLERAVLKESPRTWGEARVEAGLTWEVSTSPVYTNDPTDDPDDQWARPPVHIKGWQALRRDDTQSVLSIQPTTYQVIHNKTFGGLIEVMLGIEGEDYVEFEALMSLYEGRQIVALVRFPEPLVMPWDPSRNYTFLSFASRHDGQGGLRGLPTNVRVQCANTLNLAEQVDGRAGFTIRHTSNWGERIEEIRSDLMLAREDSKKWIEFSEQLSMWKANPRRRDTFLTRLMPIADDMSARKILNRELSREKIREILLSPTCEGIRDTGYGLLMAATEWSDHHREYRTTDSYISRQLLTKEPTKAAAASILRKMADVT